MDQSLPHARPVTAGDRSVEIAESDPSHEVGSTLHSLVSAAGTLSDWFMKSPVRRDLIIDDLNLIADAKWAIDTIWRASVREERK